MDDVELFPESAALESLLFFGSRSREFLSASGPGDLDSEREAFLLRELSRTHAWISLRVVDALAGVRRATWVLPSSLS